MKNLKYNEYEIANRFGSIVFINHRKNLTIHLEDSFSPVSIVSAIKKLKYLGVPEELIDKFINWTHEIKEERLLNEDLNKISDFKWCRLARYACLTKNRKILDLLADCYTKHNTIECSRIIESLKELDVEIPTYYHCSECPNLTFRASMKSKGVFVL